MIESTKEDGPLAVYTIFGNAGPGFLPVRLSDQVMKSVTNLLAEI